MFAGNKRVCVRHARVGSTKGGMVQYVAHGQNVVDGVTNMLYIFKKQTYSSLLVFRILLGTQVPDLLIS